MVLDPPESAFSPSVIEKFSLLVIFCFEKFNIARV